MNDHHLSTEKKSIWHQLDETIFNLVDKYKISPFYQASSDNLRHLREEARKWFNYSVNIALLFIPIMSIIIFMAINFSKSREIKLKEEILNSIIEFKAQEKGIKDLSRQIVSSSIVVDKKQFEKILNNLLATHGIQESNVKIKNFEILSSNDFFNKSSATITFTDLASNQFTGLFGDFSNKEKIKIESIEIVKEKTKLLLEGKANIIYYSRNK